MAKTMEKAEPKKESAAPKEPAATRLARLGLCGGACIIVLSASHLNLTKVLLVWLIKPRKNMWFLCIVWDIANDR